MTRTWRIALFCVPIAAIAFIFRDYFGNRFPAHGDTLSQFYPYFVYLTQGGQTLAQEIFSGFPLLVSTNSVLSPFTYPMILLFGVFNAYKFLILLHMLFAYVFTYLYARKINQSYLTSLFVATTFTFSGQLMLWAGTVPNASYYFLLPAVLYFAELAVAAQTRLWRWSSLLLAGVALGVGWLSGHSQYILYIHALFALYVVYVFGIRKAGAFLLPLVVSVAVGFTRIYATLNFQPLTDRSDGVNYTNLFIHAYWPHDLIHYLLPFFTIPVASPESFNLYVGILPLLFVIGSFFLLRKRRLQNKRFVFYVAIFAFCLISSFKYSPLAYLVHALPLFDAVRGVSRIMFIGDFAGALMAGFFLQYLLDRKDDATPLLKAYTRVLGYITGAVVAILGCMTAFYILFANDCARFFYNFFSRLITPALTPAQSATFLANISQNVPAILRQLTLLDYQTDVFLLALVSAFLLLGYYRRLSSQRFAALALVLITLNFSAVYVTYLPTVEVQSITVVPPTIQFIKDREALSAYPFRVYDLPNRSGIDTGSCVLTDEDNHVLDNATAEPDINFLYGLDTPGGYDGFVPLAVKNEITSITTLTVGPQLKDALRFMNVKYVFSSVSLQDADLALVYSAPIGRCNVTIYVYQLRGYWPRYYLGDIQHPLAPIYSDNTIAFDVDAGATSKTLYVGNAYLPRWQATVDGIATPIQIANTIYMSIPMPAGKHHIFLKYDSTFKLHF